MVCFSLTPVFARLLPSCAFATIFRPDSHRPLITWVTALIVAILGFPLDMWLYLLNGAHSRLCSMHCRVLNNPTLVYSAWIAHIDMPFLLQVPSKDAVVGHIGSWVAAIVFRCLIGMLPRLAIDTRVSCFCTTNCNY